MNLDESKKTIVSGWIAEGLKLAEIQKRLGTELGVNVTYMEVRMLVDDLKLMPKDPPPQKTEKPPGPLDTPPPVAESLPDGGEQTASATPAGASKVSVTVDTLARPGTLVSGNVLFSDGQTAAWYMDQMGRLGISPKQQGYKPSAPDLQAFQQGLEIELGKLGL